MFARPLGRCTTPLSIRNAGPWCLKQPHLSRPFHASRPHHILPEAIQLSHDIFQSVHTATGLPWALSIPLTAALFRVAWLPCQWYTNRNEQKIQDYAPLLVTWRKVFQARAVKQFPDKTEQAAKDAETWVQEQLKAKNAILRKDFRVVSKWRTFGLQLSFFPIWILNADVIRRMAGDERSILGIINGTGDKIDTAVVPPEPEFLSETCLWVSNLVMSDPFWILPITFGLLQFVNIWNATGKSLHKRREDVAAMPQGPAKIRESFFLQLSEFLVAMTFLFPFILIKNETPTAIVLYLIGSATTQVIQRPLLRKVMDVKEGVKPAVPKLPVFTPQ